MINRKSSPSPAAVRRLLLSTARRTLCLVALTWLACYARLAGQTATFSTLYSFTGSGADGVQPDAGLVQGSDGNLYGTTQAGGDGGGNGTVFKITPTGVITILHSFTASGTDGATPEGALVQGSDGTFYGTASEGGNGLNNGTVFKINPAGVYTTLHSFTAFGPDGADPEAGLVRGSDGNFYGTTQAGGSGLIGPGTVFRITAAGVYTTLHSFKKVVGVDGGASVAGLLQGSDGNFYGTTQYGGSSFVGTVFRITPGGALTILHSFADDGISGFNPYGGLVKGGDGNFYGTTYSGGRGSTSGDINSGAGTVFRITPAGAFANLYSFPGGTGGSQPRAGLLLGSDGNFYGTTQFGGSGGMGTVFQITPAGGLTTLHAFTGADGANPCGGLIQGSDGNFYGTTAGGGGSSNSGTIFRLTVTPSSHPGFFAGEVSLSNGVYYLAFPNDDYFGYYSFLANPDYIYHFDLGYEYVFDAKDGKDGVYFYDFESQDFFYTSPIFPFPYLYDFNLKSVVYYYPDPGNAGHYNTNGVRYFYVFSTGKIITK